MKTLSLAGSWAFSLDPEDRGLREQWFEKQLSGAAVIPGSLAVQGLGDEVRLDTAMTGTIFNRVSFEAPEYAAYREAGHIKFPFWLQPERVYIGAAWFQRDLEIPADWVGKRVILSLERAHWFTRVWVDGREVGTGDSLSTPHCFDLGKDLGAGVHRLSLQVDNRVRVAVGENAHSISDHTQGNWNGVIGQVELSVREESWFEDLKVQSLLEKRAVLITGKIGGHAGARVRVGVASLATQELGVAADGVFSVEYPLGKDATPWSEHHPVLHSLEAVLLDGERVLDSRKLRFGLREISTQGTEFRLNGLPVFFRGTLECCIFPLTGHPPMDVASWRKALQVVKDHGLNHVRFHSWCPPEAAFVAGDELGLYFQVEVATWPNAVAVEAGSSPAGIGDGNTIDTWVYEETARILREYGNHPCFVLMAAGNEPGGPKHAAFLSEWVAHCRKLDPRRLYTGTAGWPELPENQFHVVPEPRGHQWLDGLRSRFNRDAPSTTMDYRASIVRRTVPLISHEIGQWCAYPPLKDAMKYTGPLKARNYEIFADTLAAKGLEGQLDAFVQASGKLQALCYKEEIESALRTQGMGGFQLLDLRDFPGQGTAPVGVLNAFWESKGYISPAEFRRFCAPTVLLARLPKRVYVVGEVLQAQVDIAHFGARELEEAVVSWRVLRDDGSELGRGRLAPRRIGFGSGIPLGELSLSMLAHAEPQHLKLVLKLEGTKIENDWDLWLYPMTPAESLSEDIAVFSSWTAEAQAVLEMGGKVLLQVPSRDLEKPAKIELGFTPIFWNTWCTKGQAPHTLGILCDPRHPALAAFPTSSHSDWHWWYLLKAASPLNLDGLPSELSPVVQVIDDWYNNRKLGLLVEAKVGRGRLLISGVDLSSAEDPVKRQFLYSILGYMRGEAFQPTHRLAGEQVAKLLENL